MITLDHDLNISKVAQENHQEREHILLLSGEDKILRRPRTVRPTESAGQNCPQTPLNGNPGSRRLR